VYSSDLATLLNNLARLQADTNRHTEAEENYLESLKIWRELMKTNPDAYLPSILYTLCNLAEMHKNICRYKEAEKNYTEAFNIFTDLVRKNNDFTYSNSLFNKLKNLIYVKEKLSKQEEAVELKKVFEEIEKANKKLNKA
jgi:tetratricopeptide (TPR) repeat protein